MYKHFIQFSTAAILGLGMTLSVAQAQDQTAPPPAGRRQMMNPDQEVQRMQKQLKLSDDQVSQIRPILADTQKQMMALRTDSSVAPEDRRAKMMSIHQDSMAKVRALLTDTQKTQYDEMVARRQQAMQQRHQNGDGGAPPPPPNQ